MIALAMADPIELFQGNILIIAPHMDDEALACGGLIARLPQKERIHVVYATNGMKSPSPIVPGRDEISPDLGQARMNESRAAMSLLGIPVENLHFLELPEAELQKHLPALKDLFLEIIKKIRPDFIFIPFRYDRHLDHLAINRVVTIAHQEGLVRAQLMEYFVYYRWKLLPKRDVRKYVKPQYLVQINIQDVAIKKRGALDCFKSQTTIYYSWQTRPILTSILLHEECQNPEFFLVYDPSIQGVTVFSGPILWIKLVHRLEPFLQKWKYLTGAFLKRGIRKFV